MKNAEGQSGNGLPPVSNVTRKVGRSGVAPREMTAFWATSWSLSWESRLSMSIVETVGLLMLSRATASGTALLHDTSEPQYLASLGITVVIVRY